MEPKSQSHLSDERLGELGYAQALQKDSSGISIVIVGCGFAGLACAIESVRKGHSVIVLEKYEEHRQLGARLHPDFASITSKEHTFCCRRRTSSVWYRCGCAVAHNSSHLQVIGFNINVGRFFDRWGLHDTYVRSVVCRLALSHGCLHSGSLWPICGHAEYFHIHNYRGELIQKQPFPQSLYGSHAYNGHRAELHGILVQHALALGVEIRMGQRVTEFFEDAERKKAGVVSNGVRMEADIVVGADGVRSVARKLVLVSAPRPCSRDVVADAVTSRATTTSQNRRVMLFIVPGSTQKQPALIKIP